MGACQRGGAVYHRRMVRPASSYVSYEEFLEAEAKADGKHEWLDGVVYARSGGTLEHSRLASNLGALLKTGLSGCEVFQSDAMTYVRASKLCTYADLAIVCGPVESHRVERGGRVLGEALVNPTVLVEVLSESTEDHDRGEKFGYYMTIPSLQEYVLVSQTEPKIEVFRRPEHGRWVHVVARAGARLEIAGRELSVDDVYRRATP